MENNLVEWPQLREGHHPVPRASADIEKKKSRTIASNFDAQVAGFRSGERVALSRPVAGAAAPLRLASC